MPLQKDTRTLLRSGLGIFATGAAAAALMLGVFGGVTRQGPHTAAGWLALMLAMGCLPMGTLILLLALAKVFGDRSR